MVTAPLQLLLTLAFGGDANACGAGVHAYHGEYRDLRLAYTVRIPPGRVGCSPMVGEEGHGVNITLASQPRASMWATAHANDDGYPSLDEALRPHIEDWVDGRKATDHTITMTTLGGLRAKRLVIRFPGTRKSPARVEEYVVAFGTVKGTQALYLIGFSAPDADYAKYRPLFEAFVRSWARVE